MLLRHLLITTIFLVSGLSYGQNFNFSGAVIVPYGESERIPTYAKILKEELESRINSTFPIKQKEEAASPIILLTQYDAIQSLPKKWKKRLKDVEGMPGEGFKVVIDDTFSPPMAIIIGKDDRGLLFGIGHLLRKMDWSENHLLLNKSIEKTSSPKYPIRGHQLGYRPKTNAYDAFSVDRFDQYIRELALFGANSIEIMPPRTDDDFTSPHMTIPAIDMIGEQSRIADELDLDVWMWYPNMAEDYEDPKTRTIELTQRKDVFASIPRLDHLFVPGGDPGDLEPDVLFNWLEEVATVLHRFHPAAKIWVSSQVFRPTKAWFDQFFFHVNQKYDWFGGVVFGPWVKIPLPELRQLTDSSIPIRRYPDITHNLSSQYPIPEWDLAMAMTLGRESINPRPKDQKTIHNSLAHFANGSISYSEGTNDDVNKFIWTDQEWNPETKVLETLRDYSRFFFGPKWVDAATNGFLGQEENLRGRLLYNSSVSQALAQWQAMEEKADNKLMANFRFQMGLIRAYFDAYIQQKLLFETQQEQKAINVLQGSEKIGSLKSIEKATRILTEPASDPYLVQLKQRSLELADALYQSIGAQLTIESHGAASGRGNFIDNLEVPLNDSPWLLANLKAIQKVPEEKLRKDKIKQLLNRTNPGPGGFYDNFGMGKSWNRVVKTKIWSQDPGGLYGPRESFGVGLKGQEWVHEIQAVGFGGTATPLAWMNQITTLYDTPLLIKYEELNPEKAYKIKIAYTGRFRSKMKLSTDDGHLIHDFIQTGAKPLYEFELPQSSYADGALVLHWTCGEGERGVQVAEIWIIPKPD
ncbi:MAG: hypothetical protein GYB55_03165 [Cytophagales bacterium]|nr:hypothetical protein [Cytophagales bacterium]